MRSRLEERRLRNRRRVRWSRVFLLIIVLLFAVSAVGGAAFYAYSKLMNHAGVTAGVPVDQQKQADTVNNRINVLLLGVDDGDPDVPTAPKRSDTMIVASINPQDGSVNLLSIPRDTKVEIPGRKGFDKITHAYAYGGPKLAVSTVEKLLNIHINYYVTADWEGFIKMVDIMGGVDLYVEKDMNYDDPYADLSIHLKKGYQHLNGQLAGEYVRFRHDELGDIGRVQRQQRFFKALTDEMFSFGTIFKLPALTSTMRQYVDTDMPTMTMLKLANTMKGFKDAGFHTEMVPGDFATIDGLSYWVPDKEQTKKLVESIFTDPGSQKVSGTLPGDNRSN